MSRESEFPGGVSIIIPAYNEERAVGGVIDKLATLYPEFEILVVNDGSTDGTLQVLRGKPCRIISHQRNRGYGASWKTGVFHASGEVVVMFDGDGQFDPNDVGRLLDEMSSAQADMVVSTRIRGSHVPASRRPGKAIIRFVASFLARTTITDPNCGLRAMRKERLLENLRLLPDGFSASLTSLLVFFKRNYAVAFVPITVEKRLGTSSVRQIRDGFGTLMLVTRLIALFDPLRIFLPVAAALTIPGLVYSFAEAVIYGLGVPVLGGVMIIGGLLCFFLGIICDQISALRLERYGSYNYSSDVVEEQGRVKRPTRVISA